MKRRFLESSFLFCRSVWIFCACSLLRLGSVEFTVFIWVLISFPFSNFRLDSTSNRFTSCFICRFYSASCHLNLHPFPFGILCFYHSRCLVVISRSNYCFFSPFNTCFTSCDYISFAFVSCFEIVITTRWFQFQFTPQQLPTLWIRSVWLAVSSFVEIQFCIVFFISWISNVHRVSFQLHMLQCSTVQIYRLKRFSYLKIKLWFYLCTV